MINCIFFDEHSSVLVSFCVERIENSRCPIGNLAVKTGTVLLVELKARLEAAMVAGFAASTLRGTERASHCNA
jgi:hypothetical protein